MYENIKVTPKENSQVEITGEIPAAKITPFRKKALENLNREAKIPGFRSGHIPENVLVEKFGEQALLEDAAELALQEVVPQLVEKHAATYLSRPKITITKLAPGNPLGFSILIAVRPEFSLPNYKKIGTEETAAMAKDKEKLAVTDKEVDEVIEQVRGNYAHQEFHKHQDPNSADEHNHAPEELEKHKPEITDAFVKTLGDFKDVTDFREKIKENLLKEKERHLLEKRRAKILERLITEAKFPVPQSLVDYEQRRMLNQFEEDVRRLGLSVENYLQHLKKTREELQKEWMPEAEKRARINLILEEIARTEKLTPDPKEIETEVRRLKTQHADLDTAQVEDYVTHVFLLEKAIALLENSEQSL
jgi:trigger factor